MESEKSKAWAKARGISPTSLSLKEAFGPFQGLWFSCDEKSSLERSLKFAWWLSFAFLLLRVNSASSSLERIRAFIFFPDDDEAEGESREGRVPIKLTKETKIRIRGPWTKAIFVKLVGRMMGFNYIQSKLTQLWKPSGRMDCVNLGYGFFFIRFYAKEDLDFVLQKGP